jgi:hypothetical protein
MATIFRYVKEKKIKLIVKLYQKKQKFGKNFILSKMFERICKHIESKLS